MKYTPILVFVFLPVFIDRVVADEVVVPRDRTKFHLFLLAGQSNMAGRGKVEDADRQTHPRILSLDKSMKWVPATDPLHFDKPGIAGVGLGRTFASDYARQHPDVVVGLIPCAVGGSPISAWEPGGYHASTKTHPFDDAVPRVRFALQSGELKGFLWHQGESDSKPELATVYAEKLDSLVRRFRHDFDAVDVPFVVGQMGQFPERPWSPEKKLVDAAQRTLSDRMPATGFVSSDGLTHKGDKVHFDAASYRELGHRYFAAWQRITHPDRPNILLILADDVGREVLGCYGGESYSTPQIDSLAAQGQRYTHCYSMPVCHPTRICLLTGRYPAVLQNPRWGSFPTPEERNTLAAMLKDAGYATAVAGKWQLSLMQKDPQQPARMGFDQWSLFGWHEGPRYHDPLIYQNGVLRSDTQGLYGPDLYVDFLISFMKESRDRPFFAFYSMALCHDVTDDIGEPVPYGPDGRWLSYAEMAADMDRQTGRLLRALDELQLRDNTIVIFTTDNGTAAASYLRYRDGKFERPKVFSAIDGQRVQGGKGQLTDWGTRVPLLVRWPRRISAASLEDTLVDFSDFLPTLAELSGAALPTGVALNGHSFAPTILHGNKSSRDWSYAEGRNGQRYVRTQRLKLYGDGRLFDMDADPDEQQALPVSGLPPEVEKTRQDLQSALDSLPVPR